MADVEQDGALGEEGFDEGMEDDMIPMEGAESLEEQGIEVCWLMDTACPINRQQRCETSGGRATENLAIPVATCACQSEAAFAAFCTDIYRCSKAHCGRIEQRLSWLAPSGVAQLGDLRWQRC
eukprot:360993-Chlamydomonas_euryale.AAC.7